MHPTQSLDTFISLIILNSIWQFPAFPYIQAIQKATKHKNKNLSFKPALLIPTASRSSLIIQPSYSCFLSPHSQLHYPHINPHTTHNFSNHSEKGLTVALKHQLLNSLWWPIHVINTDDNTKLPCYTLPPTQHHNFFRNLPPLFISPQSLSGLVVEHQRVESKDLRFDFSWGLHLSYSIYKHDTIDIVLLILAVCRMCFISKVSQAHVSRNCKQLIHEQSS